MNFDIHCNEPKIFQDSSKNLKMGQRDGFSRGDIIKITTMYGCPNKPPGDDPDAIAGAGPGGNGSGGGGLLSFLFQIVN